MECKHSYFRIVNGQLRCVQCDKTPEEIRGKLKVEDKLLPPQGNKTAVNMSTINDAKTGTDIAQPADSSLHIFSGSKKRGPKLRDLPESLIRRWAEEGLGSKAIASRLDSELGIKVSYKTVQRLLSGKRENGERQRVKV
jgi:hypothetical protein